VADIGAMVAEVLGAMKVVQAFNQEPRELDRFSLARSNDLCHGQAPHSDARNDDRGHHCADLRRDRDADVGRRAGRGRRARFRRHDRRLRHHRRARRRARSAR
jgi:hypothetical protein